ncbi:hypothetical protein [Sinanaerobacter sp. ZZT-01]|uniref:flagellin N-terminal helical domain-containing protein n=1 Tax=Sinanaerobacter sp. ZZT-01 TaxID=3111540 RepID=UPI002D77F26A|nr:hypothetical protein [Sinanaerobacter sp. ZZT-01]WRR93586.1 hypothetical protein U5921_00225 [Sinanaerobacter sp. ZZT-01]
MRVTTQSITRNYNSGLQRVLRNLNTSREKVTTKRKYLKGSESPADAAKAYRLRREMSRTENYLSNVQNVQSTFENIESSMMTISKYADDVYLKAIEVNGTISKNQDQRAIIAREIRGIQEAAVMELNAKFEGEYLFGGSSTQGLPFALSDSGRLTFRGIDVDAAEGTADYDTLKEMVNEKIFIDLGFGLTLDSNNQVEESSAFNTAMPGIKFLGFGKDGNGLSNNLINTMDDIADLLESSNFSTENLKTYTDKLETERTNILINVTQLGSTTTFLENTKNRLENNEYSLNNNIEKTEYIDLASAITDFKMQEYVYQAALKMGNSILSPSFIDFMK